MILRNQSDISVVCKLCDTEICIPPGESIEVEKCYALDILHDYGSYYRDACETSKVLKLLSKLDDPFHLDKKYYIVMNSHFELGEQYETKQIVISHQVRYVDVETHIYCELFCLTCDNQKLKPLMIKATNKEEILKEYVNNEKKQKRWKLFWNIMVEPILLEIVGFVLIYKLFSMWFGSTALFIVLVLIALELIMEIAYIFFHKGKSTVLRFKELLEKTQIEDQVLQPCSKRNVAIFHESIGVELRGNVARSIDVISRKEYNYT